MADAIVPDYSQTYKHIFTSPSSVDEVMKATRSGNARIHGMTQVTSPSIVYIATQVWSSPEACQIYNHFFRHGLPSVPHLYSPGQIQSQIQNTFTRVYWLSLKMSMDRKRFKSFLSGGICEYVSHPEYIYIIFSPHSQFSQIFPNHCSCLHALTKNSVLSRIKEKWATFKAAAALIA